MRCTDERTEHEYEGPGACGLCLCSCVFLVQDNWSETPRQVCPSPDLPLAGRLLSDELTGPPTARLHTFASMT